jgi:hypothetical protein
MSKTQTMPNTPKTASCPDSPYTVKEAERDFGPCGKILYLLQKTADPMDMDVNLLFGLEACWNQHFSGCRLNQEQTRNAAMMQSVFGVSPAVMPPHARKARETAHGINWIEKVKEMQI